MLYTLTEKKYVPDAAAALDAARAHAAIMTPREQQLLAAGDQLLRYEWDDACRTFDAVLVDHPRDALALQTAHLMDFLRGDALNLRNRIARVLPHWSAKRAGLFVRARHAGVRAGGVQPVPRGGDARRAARSKSSRRTAGRCTP